MTVQKKNWKLTHAVLKRTNPYQNIENNEPDERKITFYVAKALQCDDKAFMQTRPLLTAERKQLEKNSVLFHQSYLMTLLPSDRIVKRALSGVREKPGTMIMSSMNTTNFTI